MADLPVYGRGGKIIAYAKVDDEDLERLSKFRWNMGGWGYVVASGHRIAKGLIVRLHREVLGLERGDGKVVDHINRDRLDNRKANLRLANNSQNAHNAISWAHNTSGHRGVCWDKSSNSWKVQVKINGKNLHVSRHKSLEDAVEAARQARAAIHPSFQPLPQI